MLEAAKCTQELKCDNLIQNFMSIPDESNGATKWHEPSESLVCKKPLISHWNFTPGKYLDTNSRASAWTSPSSMISWFRASHKLTSSTGIDESKCIDVLEFNAMRCDDWRFSVEGVCAGWSGGGRGRHCKEESLAWMYANSACKFTTCTNKLKHFSIDLVSKCYAMNEGKKKKRKRTCN